MNKLEDMIVNDLVIIADKAETVGAKLLAKIDEMVTYYYEDQKKGA